MGFRVVYDDICGKFEADRRLCAHLGKHLPIQTGHVLLFQGVRLALPNHDLTLGLRAEYNSRKEGGPSSSVAIRSRAVLKAPVFASIPWADDARLTPLEEVRAYPTHLANVAHWVATCELLDDKDVPTLVADQLAEESNGELLLKLKRAYTVAEWIEWPGTPRVPACM